MKHELCSNCHEDYHKNQFKTNNHNPDCSDCHTVENFTHTTYTIERHNLLEFQLKGSHLATPCAFCHKKEETWVFKNMEKRCVDCHENIHKNSISDKYLREGTCLNCHSELAWNQVEFDHQTTNYPLIGKHKEASCKNCHFREKNEIIQQVFAGLTKNCSACHVDIHHNQFEKNKQTNCEDCHTNNDWKPEKFNHDQSRFKLDGKHVNVDCAKCHKVNAGLGNYIQYKFKDVSCKSCHS